MEPYLGNTEDFEEDDFTEEEIDRFFKEENMKWEIKEELFVTTLFFEKPPF